MICWPESVACVCSHVVELPQRFLIGALPAWRRPGMLEDTENSGQGIARSRTGVAVPLRLPFVVDDEIGILQQPQSHLIAKWGGKNLRIAIQPDRRGRFLGDISLGGAARIPDGEDEKCQDDGTDHADGGEQEPGDIVVSL